MHLLKTNSGTFYPKHLSQAYFFMLFALSVSSLMAGTFLTVIYITDLKTTWDLGPVKITLIALGISYVTSGIFSVVFK